MKRSANSSNVLPEDYIEHKKRLLTADRAFLDKINHRIQLSDVLEELIRCTPCHPAICSANKWTQTYQDED